MNNSSGVTQKLSIIFTICNDYILFRDGTNIGPSKCELQRIQNIIGDCSDNGYRTDPSTVVEALITTYEIKPTGGTVSFVSFMK